MSSLQIRTEIDAYLDQIDSSFLRVVHSMLSTYVAEKDTIIGYKTSGEALLAAEAKTVFKERLEEMDKGDYLTIEELEKESETW